MHDFKMKDSCLFDNHGHKLATFDGADIFDAHGHKIGVVMGNDIFDNHGHNVGSVRGTDIYDGHGRKLASSRDIEKTIADVQGGATPAALRLLLVR